MKIIALPIIASLILTACGAPEQKTKNHKAGHKAKDPADIACTADEIIIFDAWARPVRAGQPMGAAYMSLCNGTNAEIVLTGVDFDGATAAELHITKMTDDNVASMAHTTQVSIAAGSTINFKPGDAHIMLIGVKDTLEPGDVALISLSFKNAPTLNIIFEVRDEITNGGGKH